MTEPSATDRSALHRHIVRGSIWIVGVRWSLRLMGLLNTVILARILTPDDFGLVSIATLIAGFVEIFAQTGQNAALIRLPNPTKEHYDSAWTVSMLLGIVPGLVILALSPIATAYFHEERAKPIVAILAFRSLVAGAQNVAILNFRRNLQFDRQFWFSVMPAMLSLVTTIIAALVLRNYWALVIGLMVEQAAEFVLGYVMEPFRPRISFAKVGEIWSFSIWTLFKNIGSYLDAIADRAAIGNFAGSAGMGRYYVAADLAISPSKELVEPITVPMFSVMALVQHDREKRRDLYLTLLYWSALICSSAAVGVALVGDDAVDLVLGPQWQDAKPLIPWLALSYGVVGLSAAAFTALETIGQPQTSARLEWLRLAVLAAAVFPTAYFFHDLQAVAAARFFATAGVAPLLLIGVIKPFDLTSRDFLYVFWRPFVAGAVMAAAVSEMNLLIPFSGNLRLAADVSAGATVYVGALMVLWHLSGRPAGPEDQLRRAGSRFLSPLQRRLLSYRRQDQQMD